MWLTPLFPFTRGEITSHPFAFALHIFMAVVFALHTFMTVVKISQLFQWWPSD
jgi:hypothetical protein